MFFGVCVRLEHSYVYKRATSESNFRTSQNPDFVVDSNHTNVAFSDP